MVITYRHGGVGTYDVARNQVLLLLVVVGGDSEIIALFLPDHVFLGGSVSPVAVGVH